ncbi:hypothetical protein PGT21_012991 [Puccinia graminis f. sp. tritici]|nr:hypothetical protein PGT21_012991 [Puccinia graminis f. sp. tritici]KAA1126769.1 hypothetical protein PGTUg99_018097 [Puccinia graminis f. sp. tritici]
MLLPIILLAFYFSNYYVTSENPTLHQKTLMNRGIDKGVAIGTQIHLLHRRMEGSSKEKIEEFEKSLGDIGQRIKELEAKANLLDEENRKSDKKFKKKLQKLEQDYNESNRILDEKANKLLREIENHYQGSPSKK